MTPVPITPCPECGSDELAAVNTYLETIEFNDPLNRSDVSAECDTDTAGEWTEDTPIVCQDCGHERRLGDCGPASAEQGAVSLPLLAFQACAAIGLASALWTVYLRLSAQIGGFGL